MTAKALIIGAGPAGLTAAYLLSKQGLSTIVLEADPEYVGGISKTVQFENYYADIGGHRFYSKSKVIEDLWKEILPNDFLTRKRLSRIFYDGKFYSYPLNPIQALKNLGIVESIHCVFSYVKARLFPVRHPKNLEDWVSNKFGERLYRIFFKTYTEKVWGMSCRDISADWAAQRIGELSLFKAILNGIARFLRITSKRSIKTLIEEFRYPRRGPGMMWRVCAEKITQMSGRIQMDQRVVRCEYLADRKLWRIEAVNSHGKSSSYEAEQVICSAALRDVVPHLSPSLPSNVVKAATNLAYRDFICVVLIVEERIPLADQWIYIHDSSVRVGRIQNYKSWSPEMVPDEKMASYGLEYFCFDGDRLWSHSDKDLIQLATIELVQLGLAKAEDVKKGHVIRQLKAYPVYDKHYTENVALIRESLEQTYPHFHVVGRNGMHRYNNQDHAMMTALLTVENIIAGEKKFDPWNVNQDAEYIEESPSPKKSAASGLRSVPKMAE